MENNSIVNKPAYNEKPRMRWCNKKEYEINEGYIVPTNIGNPTIYNPFDFYEQSNEKRDSKSPHQVFASIDLADNESIKKFYYEYGPLGFYNRNVIKLITYDKFPEGIPIAGVLRESSQLLSFDNLVDEYHIPTNKFKYIYTTLAQTKGKTTKENNYKNLYKTIDKTTDKADVELALPGIIIEPCDTWESLENFTNACTTFKWIMDLNSSLKKGNNTELRQLLKPYEQYMIGDIDKVDDKEITRVASSFIWTQLYTELDKRISPILDSDQSQCGFSKNATWKCDSLLTAIYLMLFLDITKSNFNTKCAHCGTWFYSQRQHGKYCNEERCKWTENKKSQTYKKELAEKEHVLELLKLNYSIKDIAKKTSVRKKTINEWLIEMEMK